MGKERQNKFDSEWREGLWLGQARSSNESVIGTMNGVVRAYTVKRHGPERQWSADLVRGLVGTPQQPNPNVPGHRIPIRVNFDDTPHADDTPVVGPVPIAQRQIRRMKITTALLQKYGYTAGCEGCRFKEAGMGEARNHTDACRLRITTAMDKDDEGRRQKAADEERVNNRTAEYVEAGIRLESGGRSPNLQGNRPRKSEAPRDEAMGADGQGEMVATGGPPLDPSGAVDPMGDSVSVDLEGGGNEPGPLALPAGPTPQIRDEGHGRIRDRSRSPVRGGQSLQDTVQSGQSDTALHPAVDTTCDPGGRRRDRRTDRSRSPIRREEVAPVHSSPPRQEIQMVPAPSSPLPDSVVGIQRAADPPHTPADNKRPRASSVSEVNLERLRLTNTCADVERYGNPLLQWLSLIHI